MRIRLLFVFFVFAVAASASQQDSAIADGEFSMLRSNSGVRIIFNSPGSNIMFDIRCNTFNQVESENMLFVADSLLMQITPVPIEDIMKKNPAEISDSLAVIFHMSYEMKNIRKTLSGDYIIKPELTRGSNGKLIGYWQFDMPSVKADTSSEPVVGQMYASCRAGNKIIMLSAALTKMNDGTLARKTLIESLGNITEFPIMIDVENIRQQMMEEQEESSPANQD